MTIEPLYSLAGVLVGVLVGLTGVGGGSLMTPILVLAFGFHPATAVGTDLLYAAATKTVGTTVHGWRGTLDWSIVRRLALGSVPTTIVTLLLLGQASEHSSATQHLLATLLGVVLVVSAVATLLRHRIVAALTPRLGETDGRQPVALTVLLGAILGAFLIQGGQSYLGDQFLATWLLVLGAFFIVVVRFLPKGLAGLLEKVLGALARQPGKHARSDLPHAISGAPAAGE